MVDTWATVGSCAQIGKNCHISGGAGIGGVLEPLQAGPVIIEDNCFVGARSEVAEGVIVREGSVLSMGVFIGASTKIVDRETGEIFQGEVPAYSVVVPGTLPGKPLPERRARPGPLLRGDRQARRREDARQDQHQRTAAGLGRVPADPIAIARELIRCPSVTPAEGGALAYLQRVLSEAGFDVHRLMFTEPGYDDIENLYARIGTGAPHLVFAGHTDVVPPGEEALWTHAPFAGEVAEGVLFGRGAVDMKGAIACALAATFDYSSHAWRPPQGLDLVPDHRRRGRRRGQRHRQAAGMGGRRAAKSSITASWASRPIRTRSPT